MSGSGYVVQSLQAAIWAVARTTDFRSAVLLVADLGDDTDTTVAFEPVLQRPNFKAVQLVLPPKRDDHAVFPFPAESEKIGRFRDMLHRSRWMATLD